MVTNDTRVGYLLGQQICKVCLREQNSLEGDLKKSKHGELYDLVFL